MKGKLIVLEGIDGCGKSTQFARLLQKLDEKKVPYRKVQFPRYQEESSALLRMYLRGDFGKNPEDVNGYAASVFFAVDRYASYKQDWEEDYQNGKLIMMDRYTTSNAVHQASKLEGNERLKFRNWLFDFEYRLLGLPRPDLVILLDVEPEVAAGLRKIRNGAGDIHEDHEEYRISCRKAALEAAEEQKWEVISCVRDHKMRPIEEIGMEIDKLVDKCLKEDEKW